MHFLFNEIYIRKYKFEKFLSILYVIEINKNNRILKIKRW